MKQKGAQDKAQSWPHEAKSARPRLGDYKNQAAKANPKSKPTATKIKINIQGYTRKARLKNQSASKKRAA